MKWKDWTPTRFSVLCSSHFEEQYIDRTGKCVKLRDDAVPTIFLTSADTQKGKVCVWLLSIKYHLPHIVGQIQFQYKTVKALNSLQKRSIMQ